MNDRGVGGRRLDGCGGGSGAVGAGGRAGARGSGGAWCRQGTCHKGAGNNEAAVGVGGTFEDAGRGRFKSSRGGGSCWRRRSSRCSASRGQDRVAGQSSGGPPQAAEAHFTGDDEYTCPTSACGGGHTAPLRGRETLVEATCVTSLRLSWPTWTAAVCFGWSQTSRRSAAARTTHFARPPVLIVACHVEPSTSTAFKELLSAGFHC